MDKELLETPAETKGKKEKTVINPKQLYAITQTDLARFINSERENGTGAKQLLLYFFYQLQGNIQKTNQPKAVNSFVRGEKNKSGLGRSNETINKIRKELETPTGTYKPLITPIKQKNPKGQITGHYIKINYPIKATYQKQETISETLVNNTKDLMKIIYSWNSKQQRTNNLIKELETDFNIDFDYIHNVINSWKGGKHYSINAGANYKPLSIRVIYNLCCFIQFISGMLNITPEYNKDTIRGLHRCLVEIKFYQLIKNNIGIYENLLTYFIEYLKANGRDTVNITTFTDLMIQYGVKLADKIKAFNVLSDIEEGRSETKSYLYWHGYPEYKGFTDFKLVLLSPIQYSDLIRDFGKQKTDKCIKVLNEIIVIEYANFYCNNRYTYTKTGELAVEKTIEENLKDIEEIKNDLRKITARIYGIGYHYTVVRELLENDRYKTIDKTATEYFYNDSEDMSYLYEDSNFDYKENPNYNNDTLDTDI